MSFILGTEKGPINESERDFSDE